MNTKSEQFCPECKFLIESESSQCPNCGASIHKNENGPPATVRLDGEAIPTLTDAELIDESKYPEKGISIYLFSVLTTPLCTLQEKEFTLGRKTGYTGGVSEPLVLDLAPYDGISLGVSQRHASIRKTEDGYEILDLNSTNGTQLNGVRLSPNQPYKLESGSVIRTGNLLLYTVFRSSSQSKNSSSAFL